MKKVLAISVIAVLCIASVFALDFNFGVKPVGDVYYSFDVSTSVSKLDVGFGVAVAQDSLLGFPTPEEIPALVETEGFVLYNLIKTDDFKFGAGLFADNYDALSVSDDFDPAEVCVSAMAKVSYKVAKSTSLFAYTYAPVAVLDFSATGGEGDKVFELVKDFEPRELIEALTIGVTYSI